MKMSQKNADNLKNEDNLKNKDNLKNEDDLKKEYASGPLMENSIIIIIIVILRPSLIMHGNGWSSGNTAKLRWA